MSWRTCLILLLSVLALVLYSGCAEPINYGMYRSHLPRSVLVMPPLNDSIEADASYVYLSTITRPLAEMGYYVFPVAVVDNFMKQNGLPTPYEMNSVSLNKIGDIFGADAVLYVHIDDWGQEYQVITSATVVRAKVKLVDVKTGLTLWQGEAEATEGSRSGGGGIVGMVVGAAVEQVLDSSSDRVHPLCIDANQKMVSNQKRGLLMAPYHPEFAGDLRGR